MGGHGSFSDPRLGIEITLEAVVDHYVQTFSLVLTGQQKADLVEFLKSL